MKYENKKRDTKIKMNPNVLIILYFIFFLALIVVLMITTKCSDDTENFKKCICSSSGQCNRDCQDIETVEKNYEDGKNTEFTDFGTKPWSKTSPGDINWPISSGCSWPNSDKNNKWLAWDYTDFGN